MLDQPRSSRTWMALWFLTLAAVTFAVYRPVWHGGFLWDDDAHVVNETLQSWSGLLRLWTDFTASQQYYPVTSTVFWLLARLAGTETFGYHALSICLHAASAFLVTVILRRLSIPGAFVAGAVFALHPVYVESVAWISELKNTVSGVWYLLAMWFYLRFDQSRQRGPFVAALVCFALALGSKTVTATLPAALLVVFWWQRGRIHWRRDVVPLVPFFALGIAAGVSTAWIEYHWVGAHGRHLDLGWDERLLLPARVIWFYASKVVWPANLTFNYPRWAVDAGVWSQYLFPAALIGVLAGLFALRGKTRAPLAAALFFCGTLFPALGFFNVYPFRFSFVADHFQYLASLGLVCLLSAALMAAVRRRWPSANQLIVATVVAIPLGVLTHQQSRQYVSAEALYRETIRRNPDSTWARGNLGALLLDGPSSGWAEAAEHARIILSLDPDSVAGHNQLGLTLQRSGRLAEARVEFERAIALDPTIAESHYNLALTLDGLGRLDDAARAYERSLAIYAHNVKALHNYAGVLRRLGRYDEALSALRRAVAIDPDAPDVQLNLADTLQMKGDLAGAVSVYQNALARDPNWGEAWNNLGMALRRMGRLDESRQAFEQSVRLRPDAALVHLNLASVLVELGRIGEAVPQFERALKLLPEGEQAAELRKHLALLRQRLR
jgi:tetratricopeptide (TPR) repeat protein